MAAAGLPVPDGFVVTTAAFETALQALDPDGQIRAEVASLSARTTKVCARSAHAFALASSKPLFPTISRSRSRRHTPRCPPAGHDPVAVRSSATSEDSAQASFAGMQDTFLWVRGSDAVLHAVRRCWASLYSVESMSYRLRLRCRSTTWPWRSWSSGWSTLAAPASLFTRSPTTGDRSVVAVDRVGAWDRRW